MQQLAAPHRQRRCATERPRGTARAPRAEAMLLQVVDGGLAGCIFAVPLAMGGRHPLGQLLLVALAAATAVAWTARQCLRCHAHACRGHETATGWHALACRGQAAPTGSSGMSAVSVGMIPTVLLLLGGLLLLLQMTPLPPAALDRVAPHAAEILPLWTADGAAAARLGPWPTVSLTPAATRSALVLLMAYGMLFFVAAQRIGSVGDVERLLRWCALSALLVAAVGLLQLAVGNGNFLWIYRHPFATAAGQAKASFTNANHFAHFLALGIGPLIWWLQDVFRCAGMHRTALKPDAQARDVRRSSLACASGFTRAMNSPHRRLVPHLLLPGLGVVLLAALLSLSRGGMLAVLLAAAVATFVCWRAKAVGARFALTLAAAGALVAGALELYGSERVGRRVADLSSGSVERLDPAGGRRMIWTAVANALPDYRLLGAGAGSHAEVYPMYLDAPEAEGHEFTHAENCYLQVALETGAVGLLLALGGVGCCAWWCLAALRRGANLRVRLCAAAVAASLAAAAAHAAVDFVWYVPALMAVVAILAAAALRLKQLAADGATGVSPVRGEEGATGVSSVLATHWRNASATRSFACAAGVLVLGVWMTGVCVGPAMAAPYWDRYLIGKHLAQAEAAALAERGTASSDTARANARQRQEALIAALEEAVRWQPGHHRAHLELAESCLRLFDMVQATAENPMSLGNVRDAALQSQFASREALDAWLARAVGDHRAYLDRALAHTRQTLSLCPLQGKAYVFLGELCFLEGADGRTKAACIEQALRVRPNDGGVLYAAATEALLAGDRDAWLDYLQRSYATGRRQQRRIVEDLVAGTPAEHIEAAIDFVVRQFEPDLAGLRWLHAAAARRADDDALAPLRRHYARAAETEAGKSEGPAAGNAWLEALRLYRQLHDAPRALACARRALDADPENYDVRHGLALCLIDAEMFEEAETHLQWCLQRRPQRGGLEAALKEALRGRLERRRTAEKTERNIR